jgi:hypothetical protein
MGSCKTLLFIGLLCCLAVAAGPAKDRAPLKTRIGILNLDVLSNEENLGASAATILSGHLGDVGGYEVRTQQEMEESAKKLGIGFPKHCREPRCAASLGSSLQMDRMVYGSLDKNDKTYAVRLTLLDVESRQIIEKVELEGDAGVSLSDVLKTAVLKLHGQSTANVSAKTHTYFGPKVDHTKQFYISAAACLLAGLGYSLANGSISGQDDNSTTGIIADASMLESDMRKESGLNPSADQVALFARPGAMGNCYVAASDDAYGVFFNPAGLSWAGRPEVGLGYQYRFGINNFAASFVNKATREIGFGEGFLYSGDSLYNETFFVSSISYKFNNLIKFLRPFSFGASVKVLSDKTAGATADQPDRSTGSQFGIGLDLGFQWELAENIRYGLVFKDAPAVKHVANTARDAKYYEYLPTTLAMGGSFQANYATFLVCEGHIPLYDDQTWRFAGGVERVIFRVIRIRAGIEKEAYFDTPWKFTGGFGINITPEARFMQYLVVDGSYEYNTLDVFAHPVNISLRWGW